MTIRSRRTRLLDQLRAAFPDLEVKVERIIAEGDLVSLHWSAVGTNTVAVPGFPDKARKSK
ncbi:ester cyclase [Sphingomonas daechungensis]|uniref:Ester cyclase n=1 Tax=Sphingomonas daechungensis TaxID=1176646 RepID=A0ABX6T0G4_9SPHN|nr:ester cyclase [Sphingomonas daechungensis]